MKIDLGLLDEKDLFPDCNQTLEIIIIMEILLV